jgi:hypothetical protein
LQTAGAAAKAEIDAGATQYASVGPVFPPSSSGRRTALARWITDSKNPLAARVAVNHVWLRHFGIPLAPTVFDFGRNGKPPTNPQLLDHLARSLIDDGWSLKKLHRRIVVSGAYRTAATTVDGSSADSISATNNRIDPDDLRFWRFPTRRMDAESVRDSVLHFAGTLDLTRGGPELDQEAAETTFRRSLYYRHALEKQSLFLKTFDGPGTEECYRRQETVVPQQSLALLNSTMVRDQAIKIAERITSGEMDRSPPDQSMPKRSKPNQTKPVEPTGGTKTAPRGAIDDGAFVDSAIRTLLGRAPLPDEHKRCVEFLAAGPNQADRRGRLIHVLINHHDFVTIR